MATEVNSFDELNTADVQTREDFLIELIVEKFPGLDLTKGGVLEQFLAYPNAILDVMNQEELDRLRRSRSLVEIAADPELADDDLVNAILSNYMITRAPGAAASGTVAIVISNLTNIVIPASTQFTVDNRIFRPSQATIAVTSRENATSANNVVIQRNVDGTYMFTVDVTETTTGGAPLLSGTDIAVSTEPAGFVRAYAAADFEGGTIAETNTDLINSLAEGISAKAVADRVSIRSLLMSQFSYIRDISIVGHGDSELTRASHNIFGISSGGKADIYVRTRQNPMQKRLLVAARPVSVTTSATLGDLYSTEVNMDPALQPGFYNVERLERVGDGPGAASIFNDLSISEPAPRGIYTPPSESAPYIGTAAEAAYSKYQGSANLHIDDKALEADYVSRYRPLLSAMLPITAYADGSYITITTDNMLVDYLSNGTRFYTLHLSYMPDITDIQDFLNECDRQAPTSSDYLVKATFPCIVGITAQVAYKSGTTPPALTLLNTAILNAVNGTQLGATELHATAVTDAIKDVIGASGYGIVPITLTGNIRLPDGTQYTVTDSDKLEIPSLPTYPSISKRTVSFITYPEYISLSYKEVTI